jgi:gamma-glutamyltranspeptidase/glutathione hydrolase
MTADDLAAYQPKQRPPVCLDYHQHRVCSAAPSTSGGVTLLQTLGMLSGFDLAARDPLAPQTAFLLVEAERLALADRARYLADPDFALPGTPSPAAMLAPAYLASRAALIDPTQAIVHPAAGDPAPIAPAVAPQAGQPEHGTSDIAIVDDAGNAVSMTTTIEDAFGARLMVHGMLLNNELTDFAFIPETNGQPVANRVQPGKRPRSSMSPSLLFDPQGHLEAIVGSAGGARIIFYVAQAVLGLLDWHLTPGEALAQPHIGALDRRGEMVVELEQATPAAALAAPLRALGETVQVSTMNSGTQAILITPAGPVGAADPRRDGAALAE